MIENNSKTKVAVITGAGGTLCSEMARGLAAKGYKVALLGRTLEKLEKVEKEITDAGGTVVAIQADVCSEKDIKKSLEIVSNKLGVCSVLVNGAGGNQKYAITTVNQFDENEFTWDPEQDRGFFNLNMDDFHKVLQTNTMGTVIPCQIFGAAMAKNGGGCIINIASMNSYRPLSRVGAYSMAKAGILNFTQWLAVYLAPAKIRVNAIAPGFFLNDRSRKLLLTPDGGCSERGATIIAHTPMREFGEAKQLLGCLNWLIDEDAADFVTGITIPVDGGFLAGSGV